MEASETLITPPRQALTVDVEDYFQVAAFSSVVKRSQWGTAFPARVENNTRRILDMFSQHDAKATFFILGWVAERFPKLVKDIYAAGHEVASHGYGHQKVTDLSPAAFYEDICRSKSILESIIGEPVYGYRAPSFSLCPDTEWAFQLLADAGYTFSSSTYPVKHDLYGAPEWPRFCYRRAEGIIEIPIPTYMIGRRTVPIGGGGYFRLYPYSVSRRLIRSYLEKNSHPYSFYFHPWEIDPEQPRMKGAPLKSRFRHYLNLHRMTDRLHSLLAEFDWQTMSQVYQLDHHCAKEQVSHERHSDYASHRPDSSRLGPVCQRTP